MHAKYDVVERELRLASDLRDNWSIVGDRRTQKVLMVFGVKQSTSLVEFKIACGDIGLNWLISSAPIRRLGNHMRIIVRNRFVKFFTREYVCRLSRLMRVNYGWRCVYDEINVCEYNACKKHNTKLKLVNRYDILQHEGKDCDEAFESVSTSPILKLRQGSKCVTRIKMRGLRIGTWNFQGLCSDRKALEVDGRRLSVAIQMPFAIVPKR